MDASGNTLLITGGATGIGLALAERFLQVGSEVVICGRREQALRDAQQKLPALRVIVADVARAADRTALARRVVAEFPGLNVLVNNAGIQRRARLTTDDAPWAERQAEIAINFEAPVHLTSLLLPHLAQKANATIMNVTSGLAFIPAVFAPVYCATKAAMHSFTVSLRIELSRQGNPGRRDHPTGRRDRSRRSRRAHGRHPAIGVRGRGDACDPERPDRDWVRLGGNGAEGVAGRARRDRAALRALTSASTARGRASPGS